MLNPDGKYQKQIQFPKDYGFFSDLAVDSRGNILLIDCVKAMVFSATKDSDNFFPLTKSLREYLDFPTSMTTDNRGTIYIVDENGSGIVILGQDGSFLGRQLAWGGMRDSLTFRLKCASTKRERFLSPIGAIAGFKYLRW